MGSLCGWIIFRGGLSCISGCPWIVCRLESEGFCSATGSLLTWRAAMSKKPSCTILSFLIWSRLRKLESLRINSGVGRFRNHSCACLGRQVKFNGLFTADVGLIHKIGGLLRSTCRHLDVCLPRSVLLLITNCTHPSLASLSMGKQSS